MKTPTASAFVKLSRIIDTSAKVSIERKWGYVTLTVFADILDGRVHYHVEGPTLEEALSKLKT